jgi:transcriptional regulator with XRE-family HTH domain
MSPHATFGPLLRKFRTTRGASQERLAHDAEVSPRHLSFLENGKAGPSREMVLVLGSALDLALRDRNALLVAAGFAPVYRESELGSDTLKMIDRALQHLLRTHEPNAAIVVDRLWQLRGMNDGAQRLLGWISRGRTMSAETLTNPLLSIFDPEGLRPSIVNWEEIAGSLAERLRRELALDPEDEPRRRLLERCLAFPGVPEKIGATGAPVQPFLPVTLRVHGEEASFFTTLTTLGTPLDVTAEELKIESYFPADEATEALVARLAEESRPS